MSNDSRHASSERNVAEFNADVERFSAYEYSLGQYSSVVATERQTDEMVRMLSAHFAGRTGSWISDAAMGHTLSNWLAARG